MGGKNKAKGSNDAVVQEQRAQAQEAREKEDLRAGRIQQGMDEIRGKFAGFDDQFYNTHGQAVADYFQPQVDKQYGDAQKELTFRLGRSGNLRSQAAAEQTADLAKQYDLNKANVLAKADAAKADLRNTVAGQRGKIENALVASEDPTQAANQSLAAVRDISLQQPDLSPLGAIFSIANVGGANFLRGAQNAKYAAAFPEGALSTNKGKVIG